MEPDPFDALLCDCLGGAPNPVLETRLAALSPEDWDTLLQRSIRHSVPLLLYRRLKTLHPPQPFPTAVLDRLKGISLSVIRRNMPQSYEFSRLLGAFHQHSMQVIVLKGAYLREAVYRDVTLRSMGDLDLMVHKTDLPAAMSLLGEMGYTSRTTPFAELVESNNELLPFTKTGAPAVDVHWTLEVPGSPFTIDLEGLWQRASDVVISGVSVKSLVPEDLLLHLCMHSSYRHILTIMGLRNLCDISEVLLHFGKSLDWPQALERAWQWRAERCLFINLYLVHKLLGAAVPDGILDRLRPMDFTPEVERSILQSLFAEKRPNTGESVPPNLARTWGRRGLRNTLATLLNAAFPSPASLAYFYSIELSRPRIYLYYPRRWVHLLQRWTPFIGRLAVGEKKAVASFNNIQKDTDQKDWLKDWLTRR